MKKESNKFKGNIDYIIVVAALAVITGCFIYIVEVLNHFTGRIYSETVYTVIFFILYIVMTALEVIILKRFIKSRGKSENIIDKWDKVVYIAHPYGNKPENAKEIEEIMRVCYREHPNYLFIDPVNAFKSLYEDSEYEEGLSMTMSLLDSICDEMWLFGDYKESKGCIAEVDYCKRVNKPYKHFRYSEGSIFNYNKDV